MRNFVLGFIVCASLLISGQAFGAVSSLIGKTVTSDIMVSFNGTEVGKGVIISDRTYLPVRDVANAIGADIEIDEGGVSLTVENFGLPIDTDAVASQKAVDLEVLKNKKAKLEGDIEKARETITLHETKLIPRTEEIITRTTDPAGIVNITKQLEDMKDMVAQKKALIPELQLMLGEVINKIAELEAQ